MRKFPKVWIMFGDAWRKARVITVENRGWQSDVLVLWEDTGEYEWVNIGRIRAKITGGSGYAVGIFGNSSPPSDTQNETNFSQSANAESNQEESG